MKLVEIAAVDAYFHINKDYEFLDQDIELADYVLVYDKSRNDIVIVKPVQLERPIAYSNEGNISRQEFEQVIDYLLDELEQVDTFFRFDIIHVFVTKDKHALLRHHVNVIPYEEEGTE